MIADGIKPWCHIFGILISISFKSILKPRIFLSLPWPGSRRAASAPRGADALTDGWLWRAGGVTRALWGPSHHHNCTIFSEDRLFQADVSPLLSVHQAYDYPLTINVSSPWEFSPYFFYFALRLSNSDPTLLPLGPLRISLESFPGSDLLPFSRPLVSCQLF